MFFSNQTESENQWLQGTGEAQDRQELVPSEGLQERVQVGLRVDME